MEERNLEMDDDGKIKLRKSSSVLPEEKAEEEGEIVIDVPDFEQFKSEDNRVGLSEEELAAKAAARERQSLDKKEQAEALFFEAEKLFAEGDADGAGEKYLDSAALYGADWRHGRTVRACRRKILPISPKFTIAKRLTKKPSAACRRPSVPLLPKNTCPLWSARSAKRKKRQKSCPRRMKTSGRRNAERSYGLFGQEGCG